MNMFIMSAVGFFSGVCASLGIGGGFVLLLYLTAVAGMPQREAQLINLLFFLPIAIIALIIHLKNQLIEKKLILPAILGGIGGVLLGVWIASALSNEWIAKTFAIFIFIIGAKELLFSKAAEKEDNAEKATDS